MHQLGGPATGGGLAYSGSALVSMNEGNLRRARLVLGPGSVPGAVYLSRYVTSHPGQLNLATPSWVGAMSTSQRMGSKGRYNSCVSGR